MTPEQRQCDVRSATTPMVRNRRGAALLVALFTIAVLASITAVASSQARQSAAIVNNRRSQAAARAMAESGVIAARLRIETMLGEAAGDSTRMDALFTAITQPTDDVIKRRPGAPSDTRRGDAFLQDTVDDGVFAVVVVDVSARLDVNNAGAEGLQRMLATVAPATEARQVALAMEARVRGDALANEAAAQARRSRDSVSSILLGREGTLPVMQPFQSLDELLEIPGMRAAWLSGLAADLTVDGDGRTNRRSASSRVLASATGALVDRPSRVLLVSRGWRNGHLLTREIQAVFDVNGTELRLVRWREQDR